MSAVVKTVMVAVERGRTTDAQIEAAGALAERLGARIVGAIACERSATPYYEAGVIGYDPVEEDRKRLIALMAGEEARFCGLLRDRADTAWRSAVDWPTDYMAREARAADLIVAFRRPKDAVGGIDIGALVLKAGRPVLLLDEHAKTMPGKTLVAWKETREARRALIDALPMLALSSEVHIFAAAERDEETEAAARCVGDVASWLGAHGIEAKGGARYAEGRAEAAIDAAVRALGADLIVAGGYGRSRLGEWIFGGVTRHLIADCSCSVLLSH